MKNNNKFILFFFFLLMTNGHAQDCGSISEGQVVRLDEEGGSLSKARVQDQDGLGTCYANTSSVLLQSSLPDSPEVSYLNLALGYAEKNNKLAEGSYAFDKDGEVTISTGGLICGTINHAKENGGVCQRTDVPLEKVIFDSNANIFLDNQRIQKEILTKISTYYDEVNKLFNGQNKKQSDYRGDVVITIAAAPEKSFTSKTSDFFSDVGRKFKGFFSSILGLDNKPPPVAQTEAKKVTPVDETKVIPLNEKKVTPVVSNKKVQKKVIKKQPPKSVIVAEKADPLKKPIMKDEKGLDDLVEKIQNEDTKPVVTEEENVKPPKPELTPELTDEEIWALKPDSAVVETESKKSDAEQPTYTREKFEKLKKLKRPLSEKENFQLALYELLQKKPSEYGKVNCNNYDPKNANKVTQELAAHLKNEIAVGRYNSTVRDLKDSIYMGYQTTIVGKNESIEFLVLEKFKSLISNQYLASFHKKPAPASGKAAFVDMLKKSLNKNISSKNIEAILDKLDPKTLQLLELDFNRYVKKDTSLCANDRLAYLTNSDGMMHDFNTNECLKRYTNLTLGIQGLVGVLQKSSLANFDQIADALLSSPDQGYEKTLTELLAPTCTEENKIKIPKDLSCEDKFINFSPDDFRSAEATRSKIKYETKKFSDDVIKSMNQKTAVGISLCTIFFQENPLYSYNQTKTCNVTRQNGLHAVSVIGYRCQKGKLDYLIQNSWGEWNDLNPAHQKESSGKAWLNEEDIIRNSYQYSLMNKK